MATFGFIINLTVWIIWGYLSIKAIINVNNLNKFLCFTAFFIPFYSLSFGLFNFQVSIYKLLPIVVIIYYFLRYKEINKFLLIFFIYGIGVSFISYVNAFLDGGFEFAIQHGRPVTSTYFGPIIQGVMLLAILGQLLFSTARIRIKVGKILVYYIYGCIALTLVGYIQYGFYLLGIPWFDFWFLGDALGRSIEGGLNSHAWDRGFYRMSSLGGEPRHFAAVLVLALLIQQYLFEVRHKFPCKLNKFKGFISCLLFSGIILSFSASALLALLIVVFIFYALSNRLILVLYLSVFVALFVLLRQTGFVETLLWKLSSLDMIIYAAKKDGFAIQAIFHSLYRFAFGYGINLADLFVPDYYLIQQTPFGIVNRYDSIDPMSSSIVPTSSILQLMINFGLIGVSLFFLSIKTYLKGTRKATKIYALALFGCVCVSSFIVLPIGIFFLALIINRDRSI